MTNHVMKLKERRLTMDATRTVLKASCRYSQSATTGEVTNTNIFTQGAVTRLGLCGSTKMVRNTWATIIKNPMISSPKLFGSIMANKPIRASASKRMFIVLKNGFCVFCCWMLQKTGLKEIGLHYNLIYL